MLSSAISILEHFIPESILRFSFEHFEIIRTDVEEVFYLVAIHGNWFLVFETDYIMNIQRTYDEAHEIFGEDFSIEGWIELDKPGSLINPKEAKLGKNELIKAISFDNVDNHLRYAVLKLTPHESIAFPNSTAHGGL